jgi:hypothetical protein
LSKTISKTLKFYNQFQLIPSPPQKGTHLKLNYEAWKIVEIETFCSQKKSLESLSNKIQTNMKIDLDDSTISQARHLLRFLSKSPKSGQILTATQIQKRIDFAYTMFSSEKDFSRIIFINEIQFVLLQIIFSNESRICFGANNF